MDKSDPSLISIPLQKSLERYRIALESLDFPKTSLSSEQALNILWARNVLQKQLEPEQEIPVTFASQLIQLDSHLKKQAYKITRVLDLSEYRDTLQIASQAWWWNLESRETLHPWNRFDWMLKGLRITAWTLNLGFLGTLAARFLTGGSGFFEVVS